MVLLNSPKIILVGLGRFGTNHLRVLKELDAAGHCKLVGAVDSSPDALKEAERMFNLQVSTDLQVLLKFADAVDIVIPTDMHLSVGLECLTAGKHTFVEKPLAGNFADAEKLVQMAQKQKRILMVGHIFRYNPAVLRIKEIIEKGELGEIYYLFGHFMGIKDPRTDIGALFNYAVHHVDAYNYLLNELPHEVTCTTGYFLGRPNFEDVAILTLRYPSGSLGLVEGSWLPPGKSRDLTIVGSKKSVTTDLLEQTLILYENHIEERGERLKAVDQGGTKIKVDFKEPLRLELLDFINSINTGQKPLANEQSALNVIKIMEKGQESARLGKTVRMD